MSLRTVAWRWPNARADASCNYYHIGVDEWTTEPVPPHFQALCTRAEAEYAIQQLSSELIELKIKYVKYEKEEERRQKERGDYWLSEEGRERLKETFDDREDGNAVRPLLDRLELLEEHIRQLGDL